MPDPRDNRGNRRAWVFVRVAVVLATLTGRQTLSSIHRFIRPRLDWLHELTSLPKGRSIARAHLPRLRARLDWSVLDRRIERGVGVRLQNRDGQPWVAVDGKHAEARGMPAKNKAWSWRSPMKPAPWSVKPAHSAPNPAQFRWFVRYCENPAWRSNK